MEDFLDRKFKILYVEDDEDDFLILKSLIEKSGLRCSITHCLNIDDLSGSINISDFDIIIFDYLVGMINSTDYYLENKKLLENTPCLLLTGIGNEDIDKDALQMGFSDYLIKSELTPDLIKRSLLYSFASMYRKAYLTSLFQALPDMRMLISEEGVIIDWEIPTSWKQDGVLLLKSLGIKNIKLEPGHKLFADLIKMIRDEADYIKEHYTFSSQSVFEIIRKRFKGNHLFIIRDVTEVSMIEKQNQINSQMGSLLVLASGMAHEVNNPLTIAKLSLRLLKRKKQYNEQYVEDAEKSLDRIAALVKELSQYSKSCSSTKVEEKFNLINAIEMAKGLTFGETKHVVFISTDYYDENVFVFGNQDKLAQTFINLIMNATQALKYKEIERNKIEIMVTKEASTVIIKLSDNGCGIKPENMVNIFHTFFTTKGPQDGTGLGLSLSKKTIDDMGGSITFTSKEGQGTIFTIKLPLCS